MMGWRTFAMQVNPTQAQSRCDFYGTGAFEQSRAQSMPVGNGTDARGAHMVKLEGKRVGRAFATAEVQCAVT